MLLLNAIDWNTLGQGSLTTLVVTAVFVIIVKPLVNQLVESNRLQTQAWVALTGKIAEGDTKIKETVAEVKTDIQASETRIIERFAATTEDVILMRENIREIKDSLS